MDPTPFSHDVLAAAEARVARAKSGLASASERAERIGNSIDWLVDSPDLAQIAYLIRDHPHRQSQFARARDEYQSAYKKMQEANPPNVPPELEKDLRYFRWLDGIKYGFNRERLQCLEQQLRELQNAHENELRPLIEKELRPLKEQLEKNEVALSEANAALSHQSEVKRYIANRIEIFIAERIRNELAAYNEAIQEYEDAQREARRIREQQIRDWWNAVAQHPIATVVEKLRNVPDEQVETVLDRLFKLDPADPHILDEEVHRFLERKHQWIIRRPIVPTALIVAHIGRLLGSGDNAKAHELLYLLLTDDRSALAGVVAYLRYVVSEVPELAGVTYYRDLSTEDLFLGACYYGEREFAWPTLRQQSQWDCASLTDAPLTNADGHALNKFKVLGLQPRIAELAFHRIYRRFRGTKAASKLRDLNLGYVNTLSRPLSLSSSRKLPPHDWEDDKGNQYDVKCNPFFRTKYDLIGLRGLLIEHSYTQLNSFPGFVFTDTTDEYCKWVYVGKYQRIEEIEEKRGRLLPFCFRLPEKVRFSREIKKSDFDLGLQLLEDPGLRIGWQLACVPAEPREEETQHPQSLLNDFINRCRHESRKTFLEYAIWKALTATTLIASSQHGFDLVDSFLESADKLFKSRALPIRLPQIQLPRIGVMPILSLWIDQVLRPLSEHWKQISCPKCGENAREPETIQIQIARMTSECTILGRMKCRRCGLINKDRTILTHCHSCGRFPLIIGKNQVCPDPDCNGLRCDNCGACKLTCKRSRANRHQIAGTDPVGSR
jgi:hypothetical protein